MEVVYRSCNGKIFDKRNECIEYETSLAFKMYDTHGRTINADVCYVVDIKTPEAAEDFLETCRIIGTPCDGIQRDCAGVYAWSFTDRKYFLVEPFTNKALKQYYKDTETQE